MDIKQILLKVKSVKINRCSLSTAIVVAAVLVAGAIIYVDYFPLGSLTSKAATDRAMAFINGNIQEGAVASLVGVVEEKDFYKISLKINFNGADTPYESYITKDGKLLFPSAIDLAGITVDTSAQETAPAASQTETQEPSASASESFAKCLTEKGMKFYGSKNCGWCAKEKELFGDTLQYVNYIECVGNDGQWTKECTDAKITSVPTWLLPDGTKESGYKTLEQLSAKSGCSL